MREPVEPPEPLPCQAAGCIEVPLSGRIFCADHWEMIREDYQQRIGSAVLNGWQGLPEYQELMVAVRGLIAKAELRRQRRRERRHPGRLG